VTITVDSVGVDAVDAERRAELGALRVLADVGLLAQRNLRKNSRNLRFIVITTIQPTLQLVLFSAVFGAIVDIPGYRNLIVPAVLIQTVTFTAMGSGVGIANDLNTGMIERLRSLPIARSAFLIGRTVADSVRLTLQTMLLVVVAGTIGFRFQNGAVFGFGAVVVVVLFGVALTTFSTWVGFVARDAEIVQAATFIPLLPLLFTSSAFSPVDNLPEAMRPIAQWNPFTAAIDAVRGLSLGDEAAGVFGGPGLWPSLLHFGIWWILVVGLFTTLSVRRYRTG
jgi:ABC-2 type transport system permease protein/oleandomycin transport system permease protein